MACAATTTIREALALYANTESWDDASRARDDFATFEWCGDDGRELPWEIAKEALATLTALEQLVEAAQQAEEWLDLAASGDPPCPGGCNDLDCNARRALAAAVAAVGPRQETDEAEIDLQPSPEGHGDATSPGYYPDAAVGPGEEAAQ